MISHVSSLCHAEIESMRRVQPGRVPPPQSSVKWRGGGEGNDEVLTVPACALQGYQDELLSRRVVQAGEIAQMRRTMQLVARGRAIERKRLAMLAEEESAAEEGAEGEAPCVSWRGCSHVYNNQTMNTTQSYYDRYDRWVPDRFRTRITQTRILNCLAPASLHTAFSHPPCCHPRMRKWLSHLSLRNKVIMLPLLHKSPAPPRRELAGSIYTPAHRLPASENEEKLKTFLPSFPSSGFPTRGTLRPLLSGSVPNTQAEIFLPTLTRRR
jgi:hypothetical protein